MELIELTPVMPLPLTRAPVRPRVSFTQFARAVVEGAVQAQLAMDQAARETLVDWQNNGIPPSAIVCSRLALSCPASLAAAPRAIAKDRTDVLLGPCLRSAGRIRITIHYVPTRLDRE